MALICLPQCTSVSVILASDWSFVKRSATVVQTAAQCRPSLSICRAAASSNGSLRACRDEENAQTPLIFKDESNGIVCYFNEDGEITCEGWDEGPHFQPEPQHYMMPRHRKGMPRAVQVRGAGEAFGFKCTGEKMGESIGEVKAESSYNCSQL